MLETRHRCSYHSVRQGRIHNKQALFINYASVKRSKDRQLLNSAKSTTSLKLIKEDNIPQLAQLRINAKKIKHLRDNRVKQCITELYQNKEM